MPATEQEMKFVSDLIMDLLVGAPVNLKGIQRRESAVKNNIFKNVL